MEQLFIFGKPVKDNSFTDREAETARLTAVKMISEGSINLEPLISNRFPFEEYAKAYGFIDANRATSMKIIIDLEV